MLFRGGGRGRKCQKGRYVPQADHPGEKSGRPGGNSIGSIKCLRQRVRYSQYSVYAQYLWAGHGRSLKGAAGGKYPFFGCRGRVKERTSYRRTGGVNLSWSNRVQWEQPKCRVENSRWVPVRQCPWQASYCESLCRGKRGDVCCQCAGTYTGTAQRPWRFGNRGAYRNNVDRAGGLRAVYLWATWNATKSTGS